MESPHIRKSLLTLNALVAISAFVGVAMFWFWPPETQFTQAGIGRKFATVK